MSLELIGSHACFGGEQRFYRHDSREIGLPMRFAVFLPAQALGEPSRRAVSYTHLTLPTNREV